MLRVKVAFGGHSGNSIEMEAPVGTEGGDEVAAFMNYVRIVVASGMVDALSSEVTRENEKTRAVMEGRA